MSPSARLRALRSRVTRDRGRREAVLEFVRAEEEAAAEQEARAELDDKAVQVLQAATETRRQELKDRVESLVTRGLAAVFVGAGFEFAFKVQLRRDVFGVVPVLRSAFGEDLVLETDFQDGRAGGIKDVCAFLLRVVVMSLARPKVSPFLVLDESFSHVSPDLLRGVAGLLRELNQSAGIQFVLVTHKDELVDAADVVYRARLKGGRTEFTLEHDTRDESYHRRPRRGEEAPDRFSAFDGQDLSSPENKAEPRLSDTVDDVARQQRRKRSLNPAQADAKRRRKQREEMRGYRARRRERDPDWDGGRGGRPSG